MRQRFLSSIPASRLFPAVLAKRFDAKGPGWALSRPPTSCRSEAARGPPPALDQIEREREGRIGIEGRGVDDDRVRCRDQRRNRPTAIAGVPFGHVLQNAGIYTLATAPEQLPMAALGARRGAGGDEQLDGGAGADHAADVAAVEDGALEARRRRGG